ncbi:MaoC family dehydratase [Pararhizobium haloflavum]|uniref:MaoC family dehydratase n=1 Tax=Pararhizobium haloflavum TaxID=2037914 RepID=UPI000C176BC7|nr:MaoC family dehydratase [Pararhizobium haloflavum]
MYDDSYLHYEDFEPGRVFDLAPVTVTAGEIIEFASQFDPQPMHLSEEAGKASILGGLAASGWHTCALLHRMLCDAIISRAASEGGPGIEYADWKRPVLAGDTLSGTCTVADRRLSASRPAIGILTIEAELTNQRGEIVCRTRQPAMMRLRRVEKAQ